MSFSNSVGVQFEFHGEEKKMSILRAGDVVQLNPEADSTFGGCFMLVGIVRSGGIRCKVIPPNASGALGSWIPYRAQLEDLSFIGRAAWVDPPRKSTARGIPNEK